ncbi:MAG: hypothetical protein WKG06_42535 [Segetibacter sp.]
MNVTDKKEKPIEAMHQLKQQAQMMKEALLKGRLHEIGEILDFGFQQKRQDGGRHFQSADGRNV